MANTPNEQKGTAEQKKNEQAPDQKERQAPVNPGEGFQDDMDKSNNPQKKY